MKTEDIIEGLNEHIESIRTIQKIHTIGHIVLQKEIIPNPTFKSYKTYKYTLWFVNKRQSHKMSTTEYTAKVLDGQEEAIIRNMNIRLSTQIFNWIGTDTYKQVIQGEYETTKV